MSSSVNMSGGGGGGRAAALFTASQWQELEHQALIFKYLMAGIPPPPDLLLPIKKSLDSMSARIFQHHPNVAWGSFYGKKVDPEPGRCRRTDGKKWRCSKDAYPDSKYCERHMHRGRNRSRKPVEAQSASQSSSIGTPVSTTGSSSFQNLPMHSISTSQGPGPGGGVTTAQLQVQPGSYWMTNKDNRYISGIKNEGDERGFFTEPSGSSRSLAVDSSLDSSWRFMPSRVNSFPESRARNGSLIQSNYPQLQTPQDLPSASLVSGFLKQQHCFLGSEMAASDVLKVKREAEGQPLRSFFDEWPKTRESWSDLDDERSNRTSFSTTQLSISIPMSSSDFSATSSRSQNDD